MACTAFVVCKPTVYECPELPWGPVHSLCSVLGEQPASELSSWNQEAHGMFKMMMATTRVATIEFVQVLSTGHEW